MANICVTGSRHWVDGALLDVVVQLALYPDHTLHVGDARGADAMAAEVARRLGHEPVVYQAFWDAEGRSAGPIRNIRMLTTAKPALLLAFRLRNSPSGSRGTDHCVREARKRGIRVIVIERDLEDEQLTLN